MYAVTHKYSLSHNFKVYSILIHSSGKGESFTSAIWLLDDAPVNVHVPTEFAPTYLTCVLLMHLKGRIAGLLNSILGAHVMFKSYQQMVLFPASPQVCHHQLIVVFRRPSCMRRARPWLSSPLSFCDVCIFFGEPSSHFPLRFTCILDILIPKGSRTPQGELRLWYLYPLYKSLYCSHHLNTGCSLGRLLIHIEKLV